MTTTHVIDDATDVLAILMFAVTFILVTDTHFVPVKVINIPQHRYKHYTHLQQAGADGNG